MPPRSLPPVPLQKQQQLLHLDQEEHMTMMMSKEVQLEFLDLSPEKRKERVDQIMKKMEHHGIEEE